jgi:hypothetical protein
LGQWATALVHEGHEAHEERRAAFKVGRNHECLLRGKQQRRTAKAPKRQSLFGKSAVQAVAVNPNSRCRSS